jgi:hypothetical protein
MKINKQKIKLKKEKYEFTVLMSLASFGTLFIAVYILSVTSIISQAIYAHKHFKQTRKTKQLSPLQKKKKGNGIPIKQTSEKNGSQNNNKDKIWCRMTGGVGQYKKEKLDLPSNKAKMKQKKSFRQQKK